MKFHWPLYSDIIFVDHYSAGGGGGGGSNKNCLLPFPLVLFHYATCLCIMQFVFLKRL